MLKYLKTYENFNSTSYLIVYHGGYIEGKIESQLYVTEDEYMAKGYSDNVYKFKLSSDATILDLTDLDTFKKIKSEIYNNNSKLYRKYYNRGYWASKERVENDYKILSKYKNYQEIEESYNNMKDKSDIWDNIDGLSDRGFKGYYDDTYYIRDYIQKGKASEEEVRILDEFLLLHSVVTNMNRLNDVSLNEFGYFFRDYAEKKGYDGYKAISSDASGRNRMEEYLIINISMLKLLSDDVFGVNESNNIDVSKLVRDLIYEYENKYGVIPCDINKGECYNFAENLASRLVGSEELTNDLFYNIADEDTKYNEDTFYNESDYGSKPPIGFKWYKNGYHAWVYYNGKHYDSETPNGVLNFYDLPIFKNYKAV